MVGYKVERIFSLRGSKKFGRKFLSDGPIIDFLFSVCKMAVLVEVADTIQQPVIAERHFVVIIWLVRLFLLQRRIASTAVDACEHMCR